MKNFIKITFVFAFGINVFASTLVDTHFTKDAIYDYCKNSTAIVCNKKSMFVQDAGIDSSFNYIEQDVIRPINGLLQHDIGAAVDEISTNPVGPHTQETKDTFKAIVKLPDEFTSTNAIEANINTIASYRYKGLSMVILRLVLKVL